MEKKLLTFVIVGTIIFIANKLDITKAAEDILESIKK